MKWDVDVGEIEAVKLSNCESGMLCWDGVGLKTFFLVLNLLLLAFVSI